MLRFREFTIAAAAIMLFVGFSSVAFGQGDVISENDTIKIIDAYGDPGDSVAIKVYLANNSVNVGGLNLLCRFDTTYAYPAYNWAEINHPDFPDTSGPLYFDMIERGFNFDRDSSFFQFVHKVNSVDTIESNHLITGIFVVNFGKDWDVINIGSGNFVQFWVHIKPETPDGTNILIDIFDEQIVGEPGRINMFYDRDGLIEILPTQVDGFIRVGGEPPPSENKPPYFVTPGSGEVKNIEQGQTVSFTVAAADPDAGQPLVLSMLTGPSGATFETAYGSNSVSNQFSWTTNFSHDGDYTATFQVEDDSSAFATRSVTIRVGSGTVEPPDDDFLYTSSKDPGGFVEGGIPGAVDVSVPVNLNDLNTLFGVQFDITYSYGVMSLDSVVKTDRLEGFEVYTEITGPGVMKVIAFGLGNEVIQDPTTTSAIFHSWFSIIPSASPGWYDFKLKNGRAAMGPGPPGTSLLTDSTGAVAVDHMGDVNLDTFVDVGDLVTVVGWIIGNYDLVTRQFRTGNMNADTEVNVIDLVAIINAIFSEGSAAPMPKAVFAGDPAELSVDLSDGTTGGYGEVAIEADLPTEIAGMQFDLMYDPNDVELGQPELTGLADGLVLHYKDMEQGRMRVLVHFPPSNRDKIVSAGVGSLVSVPIYLHSGTAVEDGLVRLENAVLSDPDGLEVPVAKGQGQLPKAFTLRQNYPNPFNPATNISFSIGGSEVKSVKLDVYNILGQIVTTLLNDDLAPGEYEVIWDGTDSSGEKQASGVYFYSLTAGEGRETKKMILAK